MHKLKYITGLVVLWLVFSTGTVLCLFKFVFDYGKVKVVVDYTAFKKENISTYWDNGNGWAGENHITKDAEPGRNSYTFSIRHNDTIIAIRIDPDKACDSAILHSVIINGIQCPVSCNNFSNSKHYNSRVVQQSGGFKIYRNIDSDDPNVVISIPANGGTVIYNWESYEIILIIIILLIDFAILIVAFRRKFLNTFFQQQRLSKIFFVFTFLLCISMYWMDRMLDFYPQQRNIENRKLVKFPEWNVLTFKPDSFFSTCTQWCSDYFYYRNLLIGTRSAAYLELLNESPMPDVVLVGKNNMMFPAFDPFLNDFTGKLPFSQKQLNDICINVQKSSDLLSRNGILFWLVLVPSKQTVYNDLMPDYYRLQQQRPTFLDLVVENLSKQKINFISLADTLINCRMQYPDKRLFYNYDTHWNEYGAFRGYQVVMNAICSKDSMFKPPLKDHEITMDTVEDNQADLAKCVIANNIYKRSKYIIQPLVKDTISTEKIVEKKQGATIIYRNPHGHGRAIFFRDSYMIQWAPFFAHQFEECVLIYSHSMNLKDILKYKPDIVIEEVGEFYIDHLLLPIK